MRRPAVKPASRWCLAALMLGAGTLHLALPSGYVRIMPPYLPWHLELVYLSGVIELSLGLLLLVPRRSRQAAWGVVALLVADFPANVHLYQHQEIVPGPPLLHLLRLPLKGVFVLWALWHTRPPHR